MRPAPYPTERLERTPIRVTVRVSGATLQNKYSASCIDKQDLLNNLLKNEQEHRWA